MVQMIRTQRKVVKLVPMRAIQDTSPRVEHASEVRVLTDMGNLDGQRGRFPAGMAAATSLLAALLLSIRCPLLLTNARQINLTSSVFVSCRQTQKSDKLKLKPIYRNNKTSQLFIS